MSRTPPSSWPRRRRIESRLGYCTGRRSITPFKIFDHECGEIVPAGEVGEVCACG